VCTTRNTGATIATARFIRFGPHAQLNTKAAGELGPLHLLDCKRHGCRRCTRPAPDSFTRKSCSAQDLPPLFSLAIIRLVSGLSTQSEEKRTISTYTYPGVYIQELPSGVHAINGVATSIAAFVGWTAQGPTAQATLVESWADFQAQFGGFDSRSLLGYAVNQFFANGGSQAYIVRLVAGNTVNASSPNAAKIGNRFVYAKNPGAWGNNIAITAAVSPADNTRFSILVQSTAGPCQLDVALPPHSDPRFYCIHQVSNSKRSLLQSAFSEKQQLAQAGGS
jgi:hypothetical protein